MEQGKGLVLSFGGTSGEPPILAMMRLLDPSNPEVGVVLGVISPDYLWGISGANVIPYGIEMCAYDETRRLIHGSYDGCRGAENQVAHPDLDFLDDAAGGGA